MTDQPTEQLDLPGSWTCQGCGGGPIMGGEPPYCIGCASTVARREYADGWPEAPVQVPVTRARGGADWAQRCLAVAFFILLLILANAVAFDVFVWHHYGGFR